MTLSFGGVFKHPTSRYSYQKHDMPMKKIKSNTELKVEEKQMTKNESSASLKDDVLGLQNIKGNVKNAYIKKINSLLSVPAEEDKPAKDQPLKIKKESNSSESIPIENDDLKMQKNRESARNSRQRKKLYIGLLEKKVEDLNNQIEGLRQQCEISFKHIHSVVDMNPCLRGMIIEQAQIFDQLQGNQESEGTELQNLLTDSFKLKFGATGSRRKAYIKYCFQNIAKTLLEGNYGPLLFASNPINKNLLEDEELNEYVRNFKDVTGMTELSLGHLPIFRRILDHKKNFKFLIKTMKEKQKSLRMNQQQLEDVVEEVTNQMSNQQFRNLLVNVGKQQHQDLGLAKLMPVQQSQQYLLQLNPGDASKKVQTYQYLFEPVYPEILLSCYRNMPLGQMPDLK